MSESYFAGLPTWTVDTLDVSAWAIVDELGREWAAGTDGQDKGWTTSTAPRVSRDNRPEGDGAYRGVAWREYRQFSLGGYVWCPTSALREQTENELAALCSVPDRLYEFRRRTDSSDQVAMVELDEVPKIEQGSFYRVDWLFTFAAPDPRKHDYYWQEPRASAPAGGAPGAGLDDTGGGLSDAGGGLDDYVPAETNDLLVAMVANYGTADASPFLELRGEQPPCSIVRDETGDELQYRGYVAAGETVWINCDEFAATRPGCPLVPGRTAISSSRGDVTSLLTARSWPQVVGQDVATFRLLGVGPPESLTVALRSAYR